VKSTRGETIGAGEGEKSAKSPLQKAGATGSEKPQVRDGRLSWVELAGVGAGLDW
jgi:hypothetical protein